MAPTSERQNQREPDGIRRRTLLAGAAALGTAFTVVGAAGCSRVPEGDTLERLRSQGVAKLGIAGEVPFGFIDENGEFTGEAPELAKVIFKRLGVPKVQPVPSDFGSLIPGLNSQRFDAVAAGMYINKDRCEQVIFAEPEYQMLDAFIVRKGNPLGLHNYQDVVKKKAKFATGTGYAERGYAIGAGVKEGEIVTLQDQVAGLNAVESGRVDVFAGTALTTREVVKHSSKAGVTQPFAPLVDGKKHVDGGGFAFRPVDTKLRDAFNVELAKMKESGELLRILRPFGFTEKEMTKLTTKELCAQ